jgi:hypothetical protein
MEAAMSSRLTAALVFLSVSFTAIAAALVMAGALPALFLALLSGLSIAAWLWSGSGSEVSTSSLLSPYLAVVPVALILDSLRFAGGWVPLLASETAWAFRPDFLSSGVTWFVAFVCAPVSLVTLGGYALSRQYPLGGLMAWWTALWAISEGLLQLALGGTDGWSTLDVVALVPAAGLVGLGMVLIQRLLAPKAMALPKPRPLTDRQRRLWAVLFLALAAVYGVTLYSQAGLVPVGIIVGSMMGGMAGWWKTTSRHPADPARIVPLYLLMMGLFYIHVGEESLTGFNSAIAVLTSETWPEHEFLLLIALAGPVVWFFAAWSVWKQQAIGNYILWFMLVGMILGEPTHLLVFPVVVMVKSGGGYDYFSGMYTALFPMIPAILAVVEILRERGLRESAGASA